MTISSGIPIAASRGTDSENVPFARYVFQRAIVRSKFFFSGTGPRGGDEAPRSAAKSGGVTSDTNHGIDFGLDSQIRGLQRHDREMGED